MDVTRSRALSGSRVPPHLGARVISRRGALPLVLLALVLFLGTHATRRANAGGEPLPLDAKARIQRRADLRTAAGRWITHRVRFPSKCPVCQGSKRVLARQGRQIVWKPCAQCKANGAWIAPKEYRAIYYDMRTEAFRRLPDIQDVLNRQYIEASHGRPWPRRITRYRIREWELVDDTHGVVWFLYEADKSPTATYWVWSTEAKRKGEWCSYDSRADGPWPAGEEDETPAGPAPTTDWEPIPPTGIHELRTRVTEARTVFRATEFLRRGNALRVRLEPRGAATGAASPTAIGEDALKLVGALLAPGAAWDQLELEWRTLWENADGTVRLRPVWTAGVARSTVEGGEWAALTPSAQVARITWTPGAHPGWRPSAIDGPAALPPPEPVSPRPEEPTGRAPDRAPDPAPLVPLPAPPMIPAAPSAAPEPPRSSPRPPPELTAKARKDAEAGLMHLRELLKAAQEAHDEGVVAHQAGSHDLWQEKLTEVRARLGEIEDVWGEEVVGLMPGADEAEQEEVANEHFGDLWNEVYRLKAMARKLSNVR